MSNACQVTSSDQIFRNSRCPPPPSSEGGVVEGGHTSQTALSTRQTNTIIKKPKNYKSTLVHLFKIGH